MSKGYQDIIWLAGRIFLRRDFVEQADEKGLDAIFAECPYGDLDDDQRAAFEAAFHSPRLRKVVEQWWVAYDEAQDAGEVQPLGVWEP
jgi:hypothetical protein